MKIALELIEHWLTIPSEIEHVEFKEVKYCFDFEELVEYRMALTQGVFP